MQEDLDFGTKFCYCAEHIGIHSTGWCSVGKRRKIPLTGETREEAVKEFQRIVGIMQEFARWGWKQVEYEAANKTVRNADSTYAIELSGNLNK